MIVPDDWQKDLCGSADGSCIIGTGI
jgi:hypothetical protein